MAFRFLRMLSSFSSFSILAVLFICIFFFDCTFLSFGVCDKLKLITGSIYYPNFQIYRFLTFFLVNTRFLSFIFDLFGYIMFEVVIEKRWNLVERVKFFLITTWIPGLLCLIYYYIKFANTKTEADLNHTGVWGSSSFVAAVMVVAKQLSTESLGQKFQLILSHSPLIYMSTIGFLQLFNLVPLITFAYSFFGLFFGWIYLRFYQKHTDGKTGDLRNSFSFVRFFPSFLQPILAIPLNFVYAIAVSIKLCPQIGQKNEILSASFFSKDVISVAHGESERHKRIALHELNSRLAQKQEPLEEWPTLFENEHGSNQAMEKLEHSPKPSTDPTSIA